MTLCNSMYKPVWLTVLFILCMEGLYAQSKTGNQQKTIPGIIRLRAEMKLSDKIAIIQRYIETDHFGKKAIPVCVPYDGDQTGVTRAWTVDDFKEQSVPSFRINVKGEPPKITGADWLNNENSSYLCGGYLLSQAYRYQATHDKAALDECDRALRGIQAIAALAGPDRFGWICKPFGEKLQDFSSPDQNIYIVEGLWTFLPYANPTQAAWIKKILPAIADYWERIHYTILSGANVWDMQHDATFMRMFKVINLVAYNITKDKKYQAVADRIEGEFGELSVQSASIFDVKAAIPGYFADWRKVSEFSVNFFAPIQLDILQQLRPEKKSEYLAIWERVLQHSLIGYDRAYGGHYYYTDVKLINGKYAWRPLQTTWPAFTHEDLVTSDKFAFWRYPHRLYWFDATSRIPLIYMMYLKNGGKRIAYIEEVVYDIMNRLDFDRMHWMVDPHHDQTIPEMEYVLHAMTSETPNYISAWYLGKQLGFWKEK